jgi:alkyl hydroperoxide reductase subunit AhpF
MLAFVAESMRARLAVRALQGHQLYRCVASSVLSVDAGSQHINREQMNYDVSIVGAGPAGLSAAIRFKQVDCV